MTMRLSFDEVALNGTKAVKCAGCGRSVRRHQKFWQTINPYNRLPDGTPKTRIDILQELAQEVLDWRSTSETCSRCETEKDGD